MDYMNNFISNDKIIKLVNESLVAIQQDEAEVIFNPYIQGLYIKNYYIGAPVDGIDPHLQVTYKGFTFTFYLKEDRNLSEVKRTVDDIDIMTRAFCDSSSNYKIYISETKSAARIAVVESNTGKIYSSSFNQGSSIGSHVGLVFKGLRQV